MQITIDDIIKRIDELLDINSWTLYRLAQESDLAFSSINNIYNRKTMPTITTLSKICKGFGISLSEFFSFEDNPLRDYKYDEDEQRILGKYKSLSRRKKEILIAYLDGLINSGK